MATSSESSPRHAWSQATRDSSLRIPGSRTEITHTNDVLASTSVGAGVLSSSGFDSMSLPSIVSVNEAERIVESLTSFPVEEVGSSAFLRLYGYDVERLSLQAHATAQQQTGDEYVVEAILTYGKLPVLVRTLLAVEAWRTFVLKPRDKEKSALVALVAENGNILRCAFSLHVETTIVGLLNLILYRRESCEEMDGETAVALVDYCARCMTSLAKPPEKNEMVRRQKEPQTAKQLANRLKSRSSTDEIYDICLDTEYKIAVNATSLGRYLCEHIESLPLGAQTRILDTHDFLVMMVPLIDEPPWTRRRSSNRKDGPAMIWEKLVDNRWMEVHPSDLLHVTKCEAQCWLAIYHLTCSKLCRERYGLNSFRKEQLLRLRKFLNDVMLDQIPVLADVMRYMDELALMDVPESSTGHGSALLMQQVPIIRDSIIRGRHWTEIAAKQYQDIFSKVTDAKDEELRRISDAYNEDGIEAIVGEAEPVEPKWQKSGCVTLKIEIHGVLVRTLKLSPADDGTVVQTPHGSFKRMKMERTPTDGDDAFLPVPSSSKIIVDIPSIDWADQSAITLTCDDINLPLPDVLEVSKIIEVPRSLPANEWRQIGTLQQQAVLQLGFKRLSKRIVVDAMSTPCCYELDQAFLSLPVME